MRDAIGGVLIIEIIIFFLLVVNSYLAFSVNYTKAFRVKNRIISIIENYEGLTPASKTAIENMMITNHYSIDKAYINNCRTVSGNQYMGVTNSKGGFCYYETRTSNSGSGLASETYRGAVYSVVVFVNIDLPVLNKIFPYFSNIFAIKGETKTIYSAS